MKILRKSMLMLCVALLGLAAVHAADAPNLTGTWLLAVESAAGSGNPTFTLVQKGGDISGTYKGQLGEAPVTGTIKGNEFTMSYTGNAQGTTLKVTYTGTVDGNTMKGKMSLGEFGDGTFTGAKQ